MGMDTIQMSETPLHKIPGLLIDGINTKGECKLYRQRKI